MDSSFVEHREVLVSILKKEYAEVSDKIAENTFILTDLYEFISQAKDNRFHQIMENQNENIASYLNIEIENLIQRKAIVSDLIKATSQL